MSYIARATNNTKNNSPVRITLIFRTKDGKQKTEEKYDHQYAENSHHS